MPNLRSKIWTTTTPATVADAQYWEDHLISDAQEAKIHEHSNKALLDTYTQTESNLADAVSKKHDHSNKSLLDTYTQTEANLADAISKKHSHANKSTLDKFGESSGEPTFNGQPISGKVKDAYKTIKVGSTNMSATDEDTFEIAAGDNITLTAGTKKVTIKSKSPYDIAVDNGYTQSQAQFNADLGDLHDSAGAAADSATSAAGSASDAEDALTAIQALVPGVSFSVDFTTGNLMYDSGTYTFSINTTTGNLEWEVA